MVRLAALLWIILGTTVAGIALIVILTVPQLAENSATLIPIVCGSAFVAAMPLSLLIARHIQRNTKAV